MASPCGLSGCLNGWQSMQSCEDGNASSSVASTQCPACSIALNGASSPRVCIVSRGRNNPQRNGLPIVPPCEEDELISSWLARVARFYGYSVADLLDESGLDIKTIDLAAIDIGLTRAPIGLLANMLNLSAELLAAHTIKSALP